MNLALFGRRRWLPAALGAAIVLALVGLSLGSHTTSGQTQPSSTATAAAASPAPAVSAAPPIDNETAVRKLLPASIRDSERLPVHKWARADMPDAPGGYVVFIATMYPLFDGQGGSSEWLLANYLQWDGTQWLPGLVDYPGQQLSGDDAWLSRNLVDITALAAPPEQNWKVFTVGYTGDGIVSPTLARTETLVEIYDLTLTTVWSRVDFLRETDTGNAGFVKRHSEDVDWVFQDLDGDGLFELVATVTDSDEIILTGDAPDGARLPAAGVTTSKTTEVYKWIDGVYVLQRQTPVAPQASPTPAPAAPRAPAAAATPARPVVQGTPVSTPTTPQATATSAPAG